MWLWQLWHYELMDNLKYGPVSIRRGAATVTLSYRPPIAASINVTKCIIFQLFQVAQLRPAPRLVHSRFQAHEIGYHVASAVGTRTPSLHHALVIV